jgi:cation diffusion facilitator CzcD-associated flavoprotein CzcO
VIKGKKVAIIGCGSSAAQIIPTIVDDVEHLTVFMRTPPVVPPRMDMPLSTILKRACMWIPLFAWIWRWKMTLEFGKRAITGAVDNSAANDRVNFVANKFMEKQVKDPSLRKLLKPSAKCKLFLLLHLSMQSDIRLMRAVSTTVMCKRPLILSTLYPALSKPNCTVVREKLIKYTSTGILSLDEIGKKRTREFDVIILGTGFNVAQYLEHVKVVGRDGIILQEQWRDHPEALYGVGIRSVYFFRPYLWKTVQLNR